MTIMEKTINWFEIAANNLTRAKQFYGSVFNVQFQDVTLPNGLKMVL
jgi:predicted enzyme related to lactoylglutathione lyase